MQRRRVNLAGGEDAQLSSGERLMERSNAWREGFEKTPTLERKVTLSEGFLSRLIQIGETVDIFGRPGERPRLLKRRRSA